MFRRATDGHPVNRAAVQSAWRFQSRHRSVEIQTDPRDLASTWNRLLRHPNVNRSQAPDTRNSTPDFIRGYPFDGRGVDRCASPSLRSGWHRL